MKTLLIDNYDSFTYNLFQLLAEVNGEEPLVVRNDEAGWEELARLRFDNVVISPGPGRPEQPADFGVCADAIRRAKVPLLGVCLGHQGLCWVNGARVVPAPETMHGRASAIRHEGGELFAGFPPEFQGVRYHSLCVEEPLPTGLKPTAWTTDGVLMAVAHRERPQWGVQFHPESVCTGHGRRLLANFRAMTKARMGAARPDRRVATRRDGSRRGPLEPAPVSAGVLAPLELRVRRLDSLFDPERAFASLFGERDDAFWLDSSGDGEGGARGRFSLVGDAGGPFGARISYDVGRNEVSVDREGGVEVFRGSIFDYLGRETRRLRIPAEGLPFDFDCGFVGWLGYELKADCEGAAAHRSSLPDAALLFAARMIAFDHLERRTYLLCLAEPGAPGPAETWIEQTAGQLASLPAIEEPEWAEAVLDRPPVPFSLRRDRDRYRADIEACQRLLAEGETYEVCLTNKVVAGVAPEPLSLYRSLRRVNPAPFSALLRFGEASVLSSSPERFLRVGRDREVVAEPIKGTARRGAAAAEDARLAAELRSGEKTRAENLTIVDLLRNDLGIVCEIGSVEVAELMRVESYETVHQLVSTVRGRLRDDLGAVDCIRACFPGGSMTGAPKKRTMAILDGLEGEARGVYSGAIGYLGLSGGCDLSIAIRTIVLDGEETTLGVGGAIVTQSDPDEEYRETLLKAAAQMRAIDPRADPEAVFGAPAQLAAR